MDTRSSEANSRRRDSTRSGGACFVCRAKKRKCSGHKPSCEQCKSSNLHCVWPRKNKRGIPKNLISQLEARLRRTETLLKHLLPLVSEDQLRPILSKLNLEGGRMLDKVNADPEIWKIYPLTTLEDIRAWQQLPIPADPTMAQNAHGEAMQESRDTLSGSLTSPSSTGDKSEQAVNYPTFVGQVGTQEPEGNDENDPSLANAHGTRNHALSHNTSQSWGSTEVPEGSWEAGDAEVLGRTPARVAFLPPEFQEQFLW